MSGHYITDRTAEIGVGLVLVVGGFLLLHDAFDGRGHKKPAILGPFLPW